MTVWVVEKLVPGGAGLCRLADGSIGFVDGGLPGDELSPLEIESARDYRRATHWELVRPSSERVAAVCPVVDACGGCDWMKLARPAQLQHKAALVAQAFERTGGVRLEKPPEVVTAGEPLRYRARVRLQVDRDGAVGFYARGTRSLVVIPACAVAAPEVARGIDWVLAVSAASPSGLARFEAVEVRAAPGGELDLVLHARAETRVDAPDVRALLAKLAEQASVSVAGTPGARAARAYPLPGGVVLRAPPGVFTQVNWAVNAALVEAVVLGATARRARTFVDLYAGIGNFSLPLSAVGLEGVAVEAQPDAARAARAAAEEQGFSKLSVRKSDAARGLAELARERQRFELVVLDPPRAGAKQCLAGIVALRPRAIAYVACDPVTLARDVRSLIGSGFRLESVTCFDMFPQTHHVETLAWLGREEGSGVGRA